MIEKSKSILDACMLAFLSISFGPYITKYVLSYYNIFMIKRTS
ncbi:Hypothetical protein EUBREC_3206 [Agathobacter rectalis ATCC 33656]|uniref:Uncharacterized protein n=1 Tax=Agathobacter rectalis (strain ATCC 33656 / DSM 3377 / JCM 17463 / KCTC 5835 / VPI 0990) TaxID=515619 RepID=C4ZDF7_AGARV|nr:Hypothetical protein EUBREC_3206 [Agathobacter rectalis ATCC 33656]